MKLHNGMLRWGVLAGAASMLVVGCGNQQVASKKNLEHALNRDYAQSADCLFEKALPFPYELPVNGKLTEETRSKLDALVQAGLLGRVEYVRGDQIVNRYSLTQAGLQAGGNGRFCYGHRHVTAVENFSTPVDYRGMPLTKVKYRFELKHGADWAQKEPVRNAFPALAKSLSPDPVDEATLVLTRRDGWVLTY